MIWSDGRLSHGTDNQSITADHILVVYCHVTAWNIEKIIQMTPNVCVYKG